MMLALLLLVADWTAVVPTVSLHVPRVEISKGGTPSGTCSAVVFEVDQHGFANALTAAHCVQKSSDTERMDITVNGRTGAVLHQNSILDLAIIRFRARNETAIKLASNEPIPGTEIAIVGYAWGEEELVFQFGHIAQQYNKPSRSTWVDATIIFGDSGGLMVNAAGELVGINSAIKYQGPARIGMVVGVTAIRDYLDAFEAMKKK